MGLLKADANAIEGEDAKLVNKTAMYGAARRHQRKAASKVTKPLGAHSTEKSALQSKFGGRWLKKEREHARQQQAT